MLEPGATVNTSPSFWITYMRPPGAHASPVGKKRPSTSV